MSYRLQASVWPALFSSLVIWGWISAPPEESPVADAAMRGETDQVRELLQGGADVNAAQGDGMTALHWTAEHGDPELAQILLYAGADLQPVTRLGDYTPLHLASRGGRADVITLLLEAGADPEVVTTTGSATPLHLAAISGSIESVSVLLDAGAAVDPRESAWGQTPLMFAASSGRTDVVRELLAEGANAALTTRVLDIPAQSAEDRAARCVRDQVLEAFRGDQPTGTSWQPSPAEVQAAVRAANASRDDGSASESEPMPEEQLEPDLDLGQLPTAPPGEYDNSYTGLVGAQGGLTALLHAVREGYTETVLTLLDAGADVNQVSAGDHTSPLLMATVNGLYDLALELVEAGADPNVASDAGTTPLYSALNTFWAPKARYPQQQAYHQQNATYLEVMEALLVAGAEPDMRLAKHLWYMEYTFTQLDVDVRGATPFWRAAYALDVPAMQLLVEHGADPTIPTMKPPSRRGIDLLDRENTELDPSGLPIVPDGGADIHPIHAATGHAYGTGFAAVSHRHAPDAWLPALQYLVEQHGADVNARDANGYTPLHWAASRGDNEAVLYLVDQGADVMAVSRAGQTTVDMANGPYQRITPFPETIALLESLGGINNHNCVAC